MLNLRIRGFSHHCVQIKFIWVFIGFPCFPVYNVPCITFNIKEIKFTSKKALTIVKATRIAVSINGQRELGFINRSVHSMARQKLFKPNKIRRKGGIMINSVLEGFMHFVSIVHGWRGFKGILLTNIASVPLSGARLERLKLSVRK